MKGYLCATCLSNHLLGTKSFKYDWKVKDRPIIERWFLSINLLGLDMGFSVGDRVGYGRFCDMDVFAIWMSNGLLSERGINCDGCEMMVSKCVR